ncbi:Rxt3-domain-containing protein, partial [Rhizodiscina lignyota]
HLHHHHGNAAPKAPEPVAVAAPPPPKRKVTIKSKVLLNSVAHLPRSHLGSKLYTVAYELPARCSTSLFNVNAGPLGSSDKFGYTMKPEPIPRFEEEQANSTFTIRVPRAYLVSDKREEITRRRFLWGADVYTDDTDPIAAAIHAGWIRGEWAQDVDEEMLELASGTAETDKPSRGRKAVQPEMEIPNIMTEPLPTGPIVPPKDMDAHITVLLLPPLQKYASLTRNGIRSREWGGNHDGLSYMLLRIEWVDEGIWGGSRGEERSGKARRKRL